MIIHLFLHAKALEVYCVLFKTESLLKVYFVLSKEAGCIGGDNCQKEPTRRNPNEPLKN